MDLAQVSNGLLVECLLGGLVLAGIAMVVVVLVAREDAGRPGRGR
jgi:hypothetical protein